ncbi:XRE family transcriptional regulator [Streptomyces sp. NBC_01262]|uniref:XRE family transcriptional regulator n=1 Tax=Streptomyces sp. NBC_01262 TaxID=2903803 RepID=UPI002E31A7E3|nr:XRE family transcriptional regulator [Streptomyces sp. NBC_01262]
MELIGHPLAWIRHEHLWSMDDLALLLHRAAARAGRRSGIDRNRVWKWEHGTTPSADNQALLAAVLQVPAGSVAALGWPAWLPACAHALPFTPSGSRTALLETSVARTDRRAFLVLAAATVTSVAQKWATTEPGRLTTAMDGSRIDDALLTWLEQRSTELRALTTASPGPLTELVDAHLHTVVTLIDQGSYTTAAGTRLHTTAAHLAHLAGWLRFDQARHGAAQRLWNAALHAAHTADDRDLGAGILSDLAYQATWLAHPDHAVTILEHARSRTHSPAARSLLDLRRARALATLADPAGCARALASAETELSHARPDCTPDWVSWMSQADLAVDAGRCWIDLHQPHRAATTLETGLRLLDPARTRSRAVFQTYQAEGALHAHDLGAATLHAHHALDTALATGAARCAGLVQGLVSRLEPHAAQPGVRNFLDQARTRLTTAA